MNTVPLDAIAAAFPSSPALMDAATWLRQHGYAHLELYSPYPLAGADELLDLRRPRIPLVVLCAALLGAATGYFAQWYPNAWDYPINVGGRPLLALPAWLPITFELSVLFAAFAAVLAFLVASGLPRFWHPLFELDGFDRISTDQYWLTISATDPHLDIERTTHELAELGALRVHRLQDSL